MGYTDPHWQFAHAASGSINLMVCRVKWAPIRRQPFLSLALDTKCATRVFVLNSWGRRGKGSSQNNKPNAHWFGSYPSKITEGLIVAQPSRRGSRVLLTPLCSKFQVTTRAGFTFLEGSEIAILAIEVVHAANLFQILSLNLTFFGSGRAAVMMENPTGLSSGLEKNICQSVLSTPTLNSGSMV